MKLASRLLTVVAASAGGIRELENWAVVRVDRFPDFQDQGRANICGKGNMLVADSKSACLQED